MDLAIGTSTDRLFIQNLRQLIEPYLAERDFDVTRMSTLLGMSRVSVHRKLKTILNQPASEFIRTQRLKRAAQLLESGEVNAQ